MVFGKSKQSAKQTFDPELKGLLTSTFRQGQQVSRTPYNPYDFATVAPLSPAQLEGMNMTADTARAGVGQQEINDAIATTRAETGFQAPRVTAGAAVGSTNVSDNFGFNPITSQQVGETGPVGVDNIASQGVTAQQIGSLNALQPQTVTGQTVNVAQFDPNAMSRYTNPYEDQVVQQTVSDLNRARQMTQNQNAANAIAAGAFGGARDALQRAETDKNFFSEVGRQTGALRQAGFDRGTALQQADLGRQQQAGTQTAQFGQQAALANQQAGLTAGGRNLQADLARQQANQSAALAADRDTAGRAQQASQQMAQMGMQSRLAAQDANMRTALANQQANLAAQQATQQGAIQAAQLGQRGELANQDAGMRAALANQNARMQAQSLNQTAGLQASGLRQGAASQLANLGGDLRGTQFADAAALQGVGAQQQAAAQQLLDDRYRRFAEEREYPFRMFDVLRSGAGLLPNPLTSSSKGRSMNLSLPGT